MIYIFFSFFSVQCKWKCHVMHSKRLNRETMPSHQVIWFIKIFTMFKSKSKNELKYRKYSAFPCPCFPGGHDWPAATWQKGEESRNFEESSWCFWGRCWGGCLLLLNPLIVLHYNITRWEFQGSLNQHLVIHDWFFYKWGWWWRGNDVQLDQGIHGMFSRFLSMSALCHIIELYTDSIKQNAKLSPPYLNSNFKCETIVKKKM